MAELRPWRPREDLDRLAMAMPQATKEVTEDGRPAYFVHGKMFCSTVAGARTPSTQRPASG